MTCLFKPTSVLLLCVFATSAHAANLVANGSFETPVVGAAAYNLGSTAITGWTVSTLPGGSAQVTLVNNSAFGGIGVVASDGVQQVDLTGDVGRGGGIVANPIATSLGSNYLLEFDIGAFNVAGFGSFGTAIMDVLVNGAFLGSATALAPQTVGSNWVPWSFNIVGTGAPVSIGFYSSLSTSSSSLGVGLDNVRLTALASESVVPEPASWALLIAGFGLVGAAMRRRRTAAVQPVSRSR